MEGLVMIYATITVVAGAIALWLHTKWGKKFLEDLEWLVLLQNPLCSELMFPVRPERAEAPSPGQRPG